MGELNNTNLSKIAFREEDATCVLELGVNGFAKNKQLEAAEFGLDAKDEFHVTVIPRATGEEIIKYIRGFNPFGGEQMVGDLAKICVSIEWRVIPRQEFYYIEKRYGDTPLDIRRSIIQMVEIDGLNELYTKINSLIGTDFELPVPHITLYTTSTREDKRTRGIGIYTWKQFQEMCPKPI